eukprot:Protomagalhaensia_wolfi_Nauph_80__5914@NODE_776_length_2011_cov_50_033976_g584_i0_p3_GENE_NODE_776_length_2011_cov_50_033976_g584_i0NODE_776_length_2011_cov_50_033976_g584_i0_p3_ORF_typecomplete_len139_score17_55NOT2_3_5/PF04153_18/6_6e17Nop52/PF05997_12/0_16_NODE_776_length_2011_cov_50_033976_g584_i091507
MDRGIDLINLHLDLGSRELLCPRFSSPWTAKECATVTGKDDVEDSQPSADLMDSHPWFTDIPSCYATNKGLLKPAQMKVFQTDTLFYFFYYHPRTNVQLQAANELNQRGWRLHKETVKWVFLGESPPAFFCPIQWVRW